MNCKLRNRPGAQRANPPVVAAVLVAASLLWCAAPASAASAGTPMAATAAVPPTYTLQAPIALDAAERWDYVAIDPAGQRVFVTLGDHVAVVDLTSGQQVGRIDGVNGAHGVAFDARAGLGFISSGKDSRIVTFRLKTLEVLRSTPAGGENPDSILFLPSTGRLYSFNGKSQDVTVINPADGRVEQTLAVGGKPEFMGVDGHTLFFNLEDKHQLVALSLPRLAVIRTIDLDDCEEPTGLAVDARRHRVFSVCANGRLMVTDARAGKVVASVEVAKGPDAVSYDARRGVLLVSGGLSGTLSVVQQDDADHYHVVQTLATAAKARTHALQPGTGRIYLSVPGTPAFQLLVAAPQP